MFRFKLRQSSPETTILLIPAVELSTRIVIRMLHILYVSISKYCIWPNNYLLRYRLLLVLSAVIKINLCVWNFLTFDFYFHKLFINIFC
jgi:hypothetical protein